MSAGDLAGGAPRGAPEPVLLPRRSVGASIVVKVFVVVPFLALLAAVPLAWNWGLSWIDVSLSVGFYVVTLTGVTVGFHRYFTHRSFKANRPTRIGLAIVGSMAFQGPIITWVADHRRHHAYADKEGDPHSPWLFGTSPLAVARGFWHAHYGCSSTTIGPTPPGSPPTSSLTGTSSGSTASSACGRHSASWPRPCSAGSSPGRGGVR
jgi:hypothetical protein